MLIGEIMRPRPLTLREDMDVMAAIHLFVENQISGAPVLDAEDRLVGILTERDCMHVVIEASYYGEPGGRVAEFMTQPVETVEESADVLDLARRFRDGKYRRYPVIRDGHLVGLISRRDVLAAIEKIAYSG